MRAIYTRAGQFLLGVGIANESWVWALACVLVVAGGGVRGVIRAGLVRFVVEGIMDMMALVVALARVGCLVVLDGSLDMIALLVALARVGCFVVRSSPVRGR